MPKVRYGKLSHFRHQSEIGRFGGFSYQFEFIGEIDHVLRANLEIPRNLIDEFGPSYFRLLEDSKLSSESNSLFGLSEAPVGAPLPMAKAVVCAKVT